MEIGIIYPSFSPIISQTVYSTEHLQNTFRRDMFTAQIATFCYLNLVFGRERRSRLSNKQLPSEYGFGLWLIPLPGQEILGWSKAGCKPGKLPWQPGIWSIDYYITIFI